MNFVLFVSPPLFCSYRCGWHAMRIGSGDCNMHAIQHECAMRCIQPHVVHVNPCTLPLPLPLPMNPIACNMKRADGCKHHLYPARNNKNVLSFLSFTRQNQQNQCIASQPQRVGGGSAIRVLNFSRQLLLYRAARATVVLSRENIPHAIFLRAEDASSTPASSLAFVAATQHQVDAGTV